MFCECLSPNTHTYTYTHKDTHRSLKRPFRVLNMYSLNLKATVGEHLAKPKKSMSSKPAAEVCCCRGDGQFESVSGINRVCSNSGFMSVSLEPLLIHTGEQVRVGSS